MLKIKNQLGKIFKKKRECSICFEVCENFVKFEKCNHEYCETCMNKLIEDKWKAKCPYCRVPYYTEKEKADILIRQYRDYKLEILKNTMEMNVIRRDIVLLQLDEEEKNEIREDIRVINRIVIF